ncbi:MAG: efflux RND transporter periplasmic adaptor subunit [Verrucomicrobiales bacterium]
MATPLACYGQAAGAKPAAANAKKPAAPPAPVTEVKKEDFRVTVSLPAVFEGTKLTPVSIDPKAWTDLTVVSTVNHGTRVKKGTRLVQLKLEALEDQIEALEAADKTAKLTLQTAIDGLANLEKTTPLELEATRRAKRQSDQDLERWLKTGRSREEETYKRNAESSARQLEYAQEELNQLQKMYDEDDLTEETEEIILKRAKISVDNAKYYLKLSTDSRDYALETSIPRKHQGAIDQNRRATLAHELASKMIPRSLALKRLEVAKAKTDAAKAAKKLGELKRDFAVLKDISSPVDGVVYFGQSKNGNWTSAEAAKKLIPGGKLAPRLPFMTIVGEGDLRVQTKIPEDKLALLKQGARGYMTPTSDPLLRIPARLGKINYASSPVGFSTSASIEQPEGSRLMPGMKGKLSFVTADRKGVITVPVSAISREGKQSFVYLPKEGADPEKRQVVTAETDGKKIAILKGLAENDKVLTIAP